jgi:hypothetical protein
MLRLAMNQWKRGITVWAVIGLLHGGARQPTGLAWATESAASETPSPLRGASANNDEARSLPSLLPLITEEAVAGIVVYPGQFFNSPVVRRLPVEVIATDIEERLGVDPRSIEFIVAFLERGQSVPLCTGWIVRFTNDYDWRRLPQDVLGATVFGQLDGQPYRKGKGAQDLSCWALDARTLLLAPDQTLTRMLATRETMPSDESISQQLSQGVAKALDVHMAINTESFRPLVALQIERLYGQSGTWQAFAQLINEMDRIELRARLSHQLAIGVMMESPTGGSAARLQSFWNDWTETLARHWDESLVSSTDVALTAMTREDHSAVDRGRGPERIQQLSRYVRRAMSEQLPLQVVKVSGDRVQWGAQGDLAAQVATCAAVTMLLNPTIQAINPMMDCWQSMDGMQHLSRAMLAYADQHGRFPARASFSADQQPLLSWRVHLLPFLGHRSLFERFHLDEPWDSRHNRQLIRLMPAVYQNPRRPSDYRTTYMVPVGSATMFDGPEGLSQDAIRDGLGNTLMLVEADDDHAAFWTQPSDLRFDARNPWQGLGRLREAGFLGARADGTVRLFLRSLDQYQLRAIFTRNGGEVQLHSTKVVELHSTKEVL